MRDFCAGGRLVRVGRRAYLCRKPTVAAVFAALERFAPEILALSEMHRAGTVSVTEALARGCAALAARPVDAAEVLSLCVDRVGMDRSGVVAGLANRPRDIPVLASAVIGQADLTRVWRSLSISEPDRQPEEPKGGFLSLCRFIGVDPVSISEWPYEALLEAADEAKALTEEPGEGEAVEGVAAPGVVLIGQGGAN